MVLYLGITLAQWLNGSKDSFHVPQRQQMVRISVQVVSNRKAVKWIFISLFLFNLHCLPLSLPISCPQSTISSHRFTGGSTGSSALPSPVALSIPILVYLVRFCESALYPNVIPLFCICLVRLQDGGRQF